MSNLFKLNSKDLLRGLLVAVLTALFAVMLGQLDSIVLLQNPIIKAVLAAALGYLSKNLATDKDGKLGGKWQIQ